MRILFNWAFVATAGILLLGNSASFAQDKPDAASQKSDSLKGQAGQKYDTKLPIEISSDNLEVRQNENRAIFHGNVIAVQGKIRMKADTMIVHYKQKDNQPPKPAAPKPAAAEANAGEMGAITLIEVEGNVFVATPEESAKGDKGNYQVAEKLLHLTGDNVVLTRGKNILRGTDLVYNLETGQSVLTNQGAKVGGPNGGRVRGVFVPNQEDNGGGKGKNQHSEAPKADENTPDGKIKIVVPPAGTEDTIPPKPAQP